MNEEKNLENMELNESDLEEVVGGYGKRVNIEGDFRRGLKCICGGDISLVKQYYKGRRTGEYKCNKCPKKYGYDQNDNEWYLLMTL